MCNALNKLLKLSVCFDIGFILVSMQLLLMKNTIFG